MNQTKGELEVVAQRVRAEFVEMPGLALTSAQAARLWGLDQVTCERVITHLVQWGFLRRSHAGVVSRAA